MQSGIKASAELKSAFTALLSDASQFALLATIESESLVPSETVASSSGFPSDLSLLTPKLRPNQATYLLIRTSTSASQQAPLLCITYTPDAAPVRQKMLFASTRLTLVRELGTEHFSEQIFCTLAEEVSPEGWARHLKHAQLEAPLTEEEREGAKLREDEATGGLAAGTSRREGHYVSRDDHSNGATGGEDGGQGAAAAAATASAVEIPVRAGPDVIAALEGLRSARGGELVVLRLGEGGAALELDSSGGGGGDGVGPGEVAGRLDGADPRYAFYALPAEGGDARTLFIYTCPTASKVKERMVYASSRNHVVRLAEAKVGLRLHRKLEGSGPDDFSADAITGGSTAHQVEEKKGFARPKRPGRR